LAHVLVLAVAPDDAGSSGRPLRVQVHVAAAALRRVVVPAGAVVIAAAGRQ
jgi:hypothetical protein